MLDPGRLAATARGDTITLDLELYSPWPGPSCWMEAAPWRSPDLCAGQSAATWFKAAVRVPASAVRASGSVVLRVAQVHAVGSRRERAGLGLRAVHLR
jgi:hypothetical protein